MCFSCSMLVLIPQSGYSSDTSLGVRSVALLQVAKWSPSPQATWNRLLNLRHNLSAHENFYRINVYQFRNIIKKLSTNFRKRQTYFLRTFSGLLQMCSQKVHGKKQWNRKLFIINICLHFSLNSLSSLLLFITILNLADTCLPRYHPMLIPSSSLRYPSVVVSEW